MSHRDDFNILFYHGGNMVKDVEQGYIKDDKDVMHMLSYLEMRICVLHVYIVGGVVGGTHEVEHGDSVVAGKQVDGGEDVSKGEYEGGDEGDDEYERERQMMMGEDEREGEDERHCEEEDEYEDGSYLPSTEREGETDDDSSLDGLISDDDEFIKAKYKFKKEKLRVITDDQFNGIVSNVGVTNTTDGCEESDFVDSDGDFVSDSTDEEEVRARIRESDEDPSIL